MQQCYSTEEIVELSMKKDGISEMDAISLFKNDKNFLSLVVSSSKFDYFSSTLSSLPE
eukprot:gene9282-1369_t